MKTDEIWRLLVALSSVSLIPLLFQICNVFWQCQICSSLFDIRIEPLPLGFCKEDGDVIMLVLIWKQLRIE